MKLSSLVVVAPWLVACGVTADAPQTSFLEAADSCGGDYCELHSFGFVAGGGFQTVALHEYCGRSGYPDSVLEVTGIAADDVIALPAGGDVILFGAPGDVALVRGYSTLGEDCAIGVRSIHFEDGTRWNNDRRSTGTPIPFDLRRVVEGGAGADRLRGGRRIDALLGLAGNDRLYGYGEDDVLDGGPGDDRLYGYEGDDVLFDGPGDDLLSGDEGDDVYVLDNGGGGGTDTVDDTSGDVRVLLRAPYLHNDDEAIFVRDGQDLALSFSRVADRVVFRHYFRRGTRLASVGFANRGSDGAALPGRLRTPPPPPPVLPPTARRSCVIATPPPAWCRPVRPATSRWAARPVVRRPRSGRCG